MNAPTRTALALAACLMAGPALAQLTFYQHDNYQGRTFSTEREVLNLADYGFNDTASSVVITGRSWEVCENSDFGGRCVVLRPGSYPSLRVVGLNDRISSVREVSSAPRADYGGNGQSGEVTTHPYPGYQGQGNQGQGYPVQGYQGQGYQGQGYQGQDQGQSSEPSPWQRRGNERLFEAQVTAARAVVGTPERRCWMQPEEVSRDRSSTNVPGAVVGALIGGIIGHQIGGGTGRDIATATGVVGGAVVGSRIGNNSQPTTRNVERCNTEPSQRTPDYWDVSYRFRGTDHRVQMTHAPGDTITVNRQGEPRE